MRHMKDKNTIKSMKQKGIQRWPLISASHRGAYAGLINTDKYMEVTAFDAAIYGIK